MSAPPTLQDPFLSHDDALNFLALLAASKAGNRNEIPVGAILSAPTGTILAEDCNQVVAANDPLGHAELRAIVRAARLVGNYRLTGCRLVSSLQPCPTCTNAIRSVRLAQWNHLAARPEEKPTEQSAFSCHHPAPQVSDSHPSTHPGIDFSTWSVALLRFFFEPRR
ncbi:MAG: nucleoside deaminase [Magnetococcales bacterium]|nr:nucleoside deaminase [Magnetococcales bacterium]